MKRRLDDVLIEREEADDKDGAFVMVTGGRVFVDGQKAVSPAQMIGADAEIRVRGADGYVGRAAHKLEAAMARFGVDVAGKICVDVGAATGGFTEVLLRRGAAKVYAIDTAHGKLALKIRQDPRVVVMERTDVRHMERPPERADIVVIDVSLISLRDILTSARGLLADGGVVVALFKPQYETRDRRILRHGVIRDAQARENLAADFARWSAHNGWEIHNKTESPIRGDKGNGEYLFLMTSAPDDPNAGQ